MERHENSVDVESMEALYQQGLRDIRPGEVVKGTVVAVTDNEVMIDVGYKAEGVVSLDEFKEPPKVGDEVEVFVRSLSGESGIVLSKREADRRKRWEEILEAKKSGTPISGVIKERVKGGYRVDLDGYVGFLPQSQADIRPVKDPDSLVGEASSFKVLEAKMEGRVPNIILSRRAWLEEELERERKAFWDRMVEGKVLEGQVKRIVDYGVFVDLGPVVGFMHISDISWKRISHPSEVLKEGQRIWVKVLSFNKDENKISLGMKQLTPDPWEDVDKKYPEGSRVKGKVVRLVNFGAFVELEEGVEGLIHVSELSWTRRVKHPSEILKEGDEVECVVIGVDKENRRISLSLKRVEENPWEKVEEKYPVNAVVKGRVVKILPNRVIVELEEGIEAFVNAEDLAWSRRLKKPSDLVQVGDEVQVRILEVDAKRRRIRAGIKQVLPDPWELFLNKYKEGDVIEGEVTGLTDFGAFVKITDEVEGLVHVSQLDDKRVNRPEDVVKVGDRVKAVITKIDKDNRRVSLSVKEYKLMKEKEELQQVLSQESGGSGFKLGDILKDVLKNR